MVAFKFNLTPRDVSFVNTPNRVIKTKIPVPESISLLQEIKEYESSNALEQLPVVWGSAKNHQIFDEWGNAWIDFTSSIFVTNSGHANEHIMKRIYDCMSNPLMHSYYYPTRIRSDFLKKLIKMTPNNLEKAILLSVGTEATERALKISRIHGNKFSSQKNIIVGGEGNYHGKTLGAQMVSGQYNDQNWIGYKDPNIQHIPFPFPWTKNNFNGDGSSLFQSHLNLLEKKGIDLSNISAFFVESFQGWGGIFYPLDYIKAMRNWCNQNNSLLIFDEIQAGFGRTGKFFAYEHYDVIADLVICGKGISGSIPLSAVLGSADLIELDPAYTSTHGGNPLACAAGLGNLEAFEKMDLVSESHRKGKIMMDILASWKKKYPKRINHILGNGLLRGVFINKENSPELDYNLVNLICEKAMEKGVFSICTGRGTLKLGPPLTIPDEALIEGLNVYEECFEELF